MKVIIPSGWYELPLGSSVEVYDLQWSRQYKKWVHVTHYGDYGHNLSRRYVIREINQRKELSWIMRDFPNSFRLRSFNTCKEFQIAKALFLAGAKTAEHCIRYSCGKKTIDNIQVHPDAIRITPYLEYPTTNEVNLLWYLLRKSDVRYSGGAGDGWMQACSHDKKDNGFLAKVIFYFNAIKNEFV